MTNVEKAVAELTDMLAEDLRRNKKGCMMAGLFRDKSILENEILNKICEFEKKHKEVEVVNIELEAYTASSVGISGVEYAKSTNVKVELKIKQ